MIEPEFNADQLADRLDAVLPPHQTGAAPLNGDETLNAAIRLAKAPHPEMTPEMQARIQARVLAVARQQKAARRASRFQTTLLLRWAAVFVLLFVGLGATAPSIAGSVPGEVLYPVKRSLENVERLLATSPDSQANVYLTQAERRLVEAQQLLERGQFDTEIIENARDDAAASAQILKQMAAPETQTIVQSRVARVNTTAQHLIQTALTAGIVTRDEVIELLPTPTATIVPTTAPTLTFTPPPSPTVTALPSLTATATLMPTLTATVPPATATVVPTLTPITDASTPVTPQAGIIISSGSVNVRKGPGVEHEVIAILLPGTPVTIIGHNSARDWSHVRIPDGRAGWIATALIGTGQGDAPPPGATAVQAGGSNNAPNNQDCAHPGSYCNAPGQQKNDIPGDNGTGPGQNNSSNNNPPGQDKSNTGPPDNPGNSNNNKSKNKS